MPHKKAGNASQDRISAVESDLVEMSDFLINQGHSWEGIKGYTLRQLNLFTAAACARVNKKNQ